MPRLTEQERQEFFRYIEAHKPLPDKFPFLLFEGKREVELIWKGKSSEVCNIVLSFQVIEQVDEPRAEKPEDTSDQLALFDERGQQLKGWTNKLIPSSLKNGSLRKEIEKQGGLKLIYIDPPFDVGADFSMDIEIDPSTGHGSGEWEERRTGDYIFENKWQSFRTKKDRSLELTNVFHECPPGRRKLAVKVVDIFGNDTMTIVEVRV